MARQAHTNIVHWVAGLDLAGLGALVDCSESLVAQKADATPLGPMGAIKHSRPLGTVEYTVSETGWLDTEQRSLRELLASGKPSTPWPMIFGHANGIGNPANIATDVRIGQYNVLADLGDLTKVSTEFYLHTDGLVHDATMLTAGPVNGVTDNTGSGTLPAAYRYDNGAASNKGATIALMVDVGGSRWRGYSSLRVRVRHSINGTTWGTLGNNWVLNRGSAGSLVRIIAPATTIRRYTGIDFLFSGTRDAFALVGNHANKATSLTVDGGTGTERIEAGDKLSISGTTYDVLEATESATPGTWNVTLVAGLTGSVNDNTVVTLTGTNTSLHYAAAIKREA